METLEQVKTLNKNLELYDIFSGVKANDGGIYTTRFYSNKFQTNVDTSPTHNCQMCSIASFCTILAQEKDDILLFLKEVKFKTGKKLALVDIKSNLMSYVDEKIPKGRIVMNQPYTSSNSSQMSIIIINIDGI